jgi:sugar phosphate permease
MASEGETPGKKRNCGFQFTEVDDQIYERLSKYMGDPLQRKNTLAVLTLCVTYVLLIFPRVAFSAISSNLKDDLGFGNNDVSDVLIVQGVSYAIGKVFNGVIIDMVDARYTLWAFLVLSIAASFGWSFAKSKTAMYPFIFVNMYAQAGTWPCMTKMIYTWFDANAYGQVFSFLALSSKFGSFCTLLILGGVVSATDWRWTLRVASSACALGLIYSLVMMRNRPAPPIRKDHRKMTSKDEGRGLVKLIKVIYKSARFWLCLATISTMTVLAGMESLIPLLLTDVFRPCTDTSDDAGDVCDSTFNSGHAAIVAALVPLGLILSLIFGQIYLDGKHPVNAAKASVILLVAATVMLVIFSIWTTMVESGSRPKEDPWNWVGFLMVFIFLYGCCIGYPYYIPVSVYSVNVGGANAATLSTILDLGGFALLTAFSQFGTSLSEMDGVSTTATSTWRYNLYLVTFIGVLSCLAMFGFQNYNLRTMKSKALQEAVDSFLDTVLETEGKSENKAVGTRSFAL